ARCLIARGQRQEGREVLEQLARLDPREELVRGLLDELDEQDRTGQIPPVINLPDENDDDEPDEE
ncbi:MAG: hypothetical protein ACKOJF_36525, partial [Planctomycetaceae bacterium]